MARKPLTKQQKLFLQILGGLVGLTGVALMVAQVRPQFSAEPPDMQWTPTFIAVFMILVGVEAFLLRITRWSGAAVGGFLKRFTGAAGGTPETDEAKPEDDG